MSLIRCSAYVCAFIDSLCNFDLDVVRIYVPSRTFRIYFSTLCAGVVFVAIPYSISFVVQALYGWPNKPGYKKYLEALKPRRVYCLTRAVLEMLKYLQYGKLFFKWKSWYRKVKNNKQCVKGTVLHMIQDISDSLVCVRENGHSFSTDKAEELCIRQFEQKDITDSIKGIVGLSGVYNIMEHYQHEKMKAVKYVSAMHKAVEGINNFEYYSPTALLRKQNEDMLKRVPPVGRPMTDDVIFPVELSVRFSKLLTLLSVKTTLYLLPEMNHIQIVTDFMAPDRHFYRIVFGCIKREYSKFMRTY